MFHNKKRLSSRRNVQASYKSVLGPSESSRLVLLWSLASGILALTWTSR